MKNYYDILGVSKDTNPDELKYGNYMSKLAQIYQTDDGNASLTDSEIEALVEYLQSLK